MRGVVTGEDCTTGRCLNDCSDQGQCVNGTCRCRPGYVGEDCSLVYCASNCSQKGLCKEGFCVCQEGFAGDDCNSGKGDRVKDERAGRYGCCVMDEGGIDMQNVPYKKSLLKYKCKSISDGLAYA